jgi:hypothetical protein
VTTLREVTVSTADVPGPHPAAPRPGPHSAVPGPGPVPGGPRPGPPPRPGAAVPGRVPFPGGAPTVDADAPESRHPAVDAALRGIANAAELSPADQIAQYEAALRILQETLAGIDQN